MFQRLQLMPYIHVRQYESKKWTVVRQIWCNEGCAFKQYVFNSLAAWRKATQCNDVWCKVERRRRRRNVQKFNEQRVVCYWQRGIDKIRTRQREEIEEHGKFEEYIKKTQKILE